LENHVEPIASFSGHTPDIWSVVVPQIAYHSPALRQGMMACGTLIQSMLRKELGAAAERSTTVILRHASRSVGELANNHRPIIEVVLTAWTFWLLDLMRGLFQSAVVHIISAVQISRRCRKELSSDALASSFIEGMLANVPEPGAADSIALDPAIRHDPPLVRQAKAVPKLEHAYVQIVTCIDRVGFSHVVRKAQILSTLELARQEIWYALSRYNTPEQFALWMHKARSADPDQIPWFHLVDSPGLYARPINILDDHLLTHIVFNMEEWTKEIGRTTLLFLIMTAEADLPMRHITMDFFEYARQIRLPRSSAQGWS
jgi:hypothetical protein